MPLQNRVTPFGEIVAIPERGTLMGNRGILHDASSQIRRRWAGRAWISCVLEFRGRRDPVMAPGHYTRLFFLDEPTALAAGHRPCAFCRRADYLAFRAAWAQGNVHLGLGPQPRATEIDRALHGERLGPGGTKRLHPASLDSLPDGVMVGLSETTHRSLSLPSGDQAYLIWKGGFWAWSPDGYLPHAEKVSAEVLLLTPPSTVAALAAGYVSGSPAGLTST
ncbi:MAG: hypothetical protein AB7P40_09325 [Chloroflexota bacterium]